MKLSFYLNQFSLESTLYHMKDYKVAQQLRVRYQNEEMSKDGTTEGSTSDRILIGMKQVNDKKYDTSYINLYKYLNSSVMVLEDVFNTLLVGLKAKGTYIEKGGTNK